jgi:hypothetical protein
VLQHQSPGGKLDTHSSFFFLYVHTRLSSFLPLAHSSFLTPWYFCFSLLNQMTFKKLFLFRPAVFLNTHTNPNGEPEWSYL